jgi:hypothetical protein
LLEEYVPLRLQRKISVLPSVLLPTKFLSDLKAILVQLDPVAMEGCFDPVPPVVEVIWVRLLPVLSHI